MREDRPGSACPDPDLCIWAGPERVGANRRCSLCGGAWVNCLDAGCFVAPDGRPTDPDNSPGACERRLRALSKEAK